jgi:hypothetical protein
MKDKSKKLLWDKSKKWSYKKTQYFCRACGHITSKENPYCPTHGYISSPSPSRKALEVLTALRSNADRLNFWWSKERGEFNLSKMKSRVAHIARRHGIW